MRGACAALVALSMGCSTSVYRLDGEVKTPAGTAKTPCEQKGWFVVAPTRSEEPDENGRTTHVRRDGLGIFRVGSKVPTSIPAAEKDLGPSPMIDRHVEGVREHDRDRIVATAMGIGGLIALTVGTVLFATSFETVNQGQTNEDQRIDGTRATWGGIVVGVGFGLGIGGMVLNPDHAERARAEQSRYVFLPPEEDEGAVVELIDRHNVRIRQSCARLEGKAVRDDEGDQEVEESVDPDEDEPLDEEDAPAEDDAGEGAGEDY